MSSVRSNNDISAPFFIHFQSFIERHPLFLTVFLFILLIMDISVNDRLKQARNALNLSQKQFAAGIYLKGSGYIGDIEIYRHEVNDRIIELVSSVYGVNKTWLKTGNGKMFEGKKLDKQLHEINTLFNQLNPHFKSYVLSQIKQLIKLQSTGTGG